MILQADSTKNLMRKEESQKVVSLKPGSKTKKVKRVRFHCPTPKDNIHSEYLLLAMQPDNFKKLKSVLPQNELQNTLESPKLLHEALIEHDLYDGELFKSIKEQYELQLKKKFKMIKLDGSESIIEGQAVRKENELKPAEDPDRVITPSMMRNNRKDADTTADSPLPKRPGNSRIFRKPQSRNQSRPLSSKASSRSSRNDHLMSNNVYCRPRTADGVYQSANNFLETSSLEERAYNSYTFEQKVGAPTKAKNTEKYKSAQANECVWPSNGKEAHTTTVSKLFGKIDIYFLHTLISILS